MIITEICQKPVNDIIADILNLLLDTEINSWDLDFAIGRRCLRTVRCGRKITLGECWHNPELDYAHLERCISRKLSADGNCSFWTKTAIHIAVLWALYGLMVKNEDLQMGEIVDISMMVGDFSSAVGAVYARKMGLPVGAILVCCNDNHALWELFHYGQLRTDGVSRKTETPEADIVLPVGLEHLIYCSGGTNEVQQFLSCCREGRTYCPEQSVLSALQKGLYISVISESRMAQTVSGIWSSQKYLLSPYTAIAYAGVQDYRARIGESSQTLVLAEKSPERDPELTSRLLGLTTAELSEKIKER